MWHRCSVGRMWGRCRLFLRWPIVPGLGVNDGRWGEKRILLYLDDDEAGAAVVGSLVVHRRLVVGDVEAFDGVTLLDLIDMRGCQSSRLA